ncbi:DUF6702 family protein [Muriicola soli]|uniref:DUF6702 family protein n=1 Tax=Muriicola soli TaxID=2507538 RepID=UPI001FEA8D23|nr:DUF6702 family protein [Muriicola soli]
MKVLYLFFIPLIIAFGVHKFYVSVTQIEYYAAEEAIQITSRVFIDDLERALLERYEVKAILGTPQEISEADRLIERYLKSKFVVQINDIQVNYNYLGKKTDSDMIILFLEIPGFSLDKLNSLEIQNELLMDVFEEQKNILHFKFGDKKKSFVLIRESSKGMLNF